jgi:surface antigen
MAVVGGIFAVAALPAYAVTTSETPGAALSGASQQISVASSAIADAASRDVFTATTPEELAAKKAAEAEAAANAAAALAAASYVYTDPGPRVAGDDYPWRGMGEGLSPLNYYMGECVDFVAWRLNRDAGATGPFKWVWSNLTPGGGSAGSWQGAWEAHGWPVSSTPVAGAVAVTGYMHVAYVKEVYGDGTVLVEEYNYAGYHQYGTRVLPASSVTAFLYPPG